jgi:PAS domain S-box-containing protein
MQVRRKNRKISSDCFFELGELIRYSSSLLDQLNEGVLIADHNCVVRYVNPRYTTITGVEFENIVGRHIRDVRPHALLPEVVERNKPIEGVYRREGKVEYIVNISPLFINNRIVGGLSIVMDITKVKKMARELDKSISQLRRIKSSIRGFFPSRYTFNDILGESPSITRAKEIAIKVAQSNSNVLISGESGTGKEMFAHAIHHESSRRENPFIPVNCAAISPSLVESELFGYSDGAFTGAKKGGKIGLLELANHGTVFLDEIGDMNVQQQAKILRVLEDKRFIKVGGTMEKELDIRVISCTNKDLESLTRKKLFREDLYYRLNAVQLNIPPLRERLDDIPVITNFLLENLSQEGKKRIKISHEAIETLQLYPYPGNVRELKHIIEYCFLMSDDIITPEQLPARIVERSRDLSESHHKILPLEASIRAHEEKMIRIALSTFGTTLEGKRKAGEALGISLSTLYSKLNPRK